MVHVIKKKRFWLGVLLAGVLAIVVFLPLILSSNTVLQMVVSRVNRTVPGHLTINSWLVDWQQGLVCEDIEYKDDRKGIRLAIPRLTSTQGLAELVLAPKNLGLIGLDSPVVELSDSMFSGEGVPLSDKQASSPENSATGWDELVLQLQVRDGMVKTVLQDSKTGLGVKNIVLHSNLADGVVDFDLKFQAMGDQGIVEAQGSLNLPARRNNLLETLIINADVTINDYQIRDYLSFLAPYSHFPTGEGILNTDCKVKVVGLEEIEFSGEAGLTDLKLAGGILGEDTPSFQRINLSLEGAEWSRLYWTVKQMNLETDGGSLSFSGELKNSKIQLISKGTLHVPVLFDQLPHLFHVHEATLIESGFLDFTADFSLDGLQGQLDIKARTENIGGLFDGNAFVWDNPLIAILNGEMNGLDFRVRRLQIDAPFAKIYGQGNLNTFDIEASADLGTTLIEIGKLFQHPWSGTGELALEAHANVGESGEENYNVETDLNISNFSLNKSETVIIPHHQFSIVGSAQAPLSLLKNKKGSFDLQFALSSWLGEVFLALNGERKEKGSAWSRYSTDTNFNLDYLSNFLLVLDRMLPVTEMSGDLQVQATGYIDQSILEINELNSRIHDLSFMWNNIEFHDKDVNLQILRSVNDEVPSLAIHDLIVTGNSEQYFNSGTGSNLLQFPDRSVFLHNVLLDAEMGEMRLDKLRIEDWLEPLKNINADFSVNGDMAKLTPLLLNAGLLKQKTELAGAGQMIFHAADKGDTGQDIQADIFLDNFSLSLQDKILLTHEKVNIATRLTGQITHGDFAINEIMLHSGPLDVEATGAVTSAEQEKILELQGKLTPKMDKIGTIIGTVFDLPITMRGEKSDSFQVKYYFGGDKGQGLRRSLFSTSLYADKIEYKGIELGAIKMPLTFDENNLHVELSGRMNDGVLNLVTDSNFNLEPPVLQIPPASPVMTGVQLRKTVVDGLLQDIHPLFGIVAAPSGMIDAVVDSLTWPLKAGGEQEADFVAIINTSEVNFDSTGFMRGILNSFGLDKEKLTLKDSRIYCTGRDGRIICSPVRILAGDSEMELSGSVGMDKSMDYLLQVPVTEKLVGREGYRILEGTVVRVPIKGTVGNPAFDKNMLSSTIRDLLQQAAARAIEKKAGEIIPGLLEGILGSPQQQ